MQELVFFIEKKQEEEMNQVILRGRLTKDPVVKTINKNDKESKVCNYTLAVTKSYKNKEGKKDAQFFNIESWGQNASFVGDYMKKGSELLVIGELKQDKPYTDSKNVVHEGNSVRTSVVEPINYRSEFSMKKEIGQAMLSNGLDINMVSKCLQIDIEKAKKLFNPSENLVVPDEE
jgi:single-strand DNA-binding protein